MIQKNGGIPEYENDLGRKTLVRVRSCVIENREISPRTVYVRGNPDMWFSTPASCRVKGKTITGYLTGDDNGELVFRVHTGEL